MQQLIFSIRDAKGDFFNQPFPQLTKAEALRTFSELANDPQSRIAKHPEDYDLYYLGTYETVTGQLDPLKSPEQVQKAIHCIKKNINPVDLKN